MHAYPPGRRRSDSHPATRRSATAPPANARGTIGGPFGRAEPPRVASRRRDSARARARWTPVWMGDARRLPPAPPRCDRSLGRPRRRRRLRLPSTGTVPHRPRRSPRGRGGRIAVTAAVSRGGIPATAAPAARIRARRGAAAGGCVGRPAAPGASIHRVRCPTTIPDVARLHDGARGAGRGPAPAASRPAPVTPERIRVREASAALDSDVIEAAHPAAPP